MKRNAMPIVGLLPLGLLAPAGAAPQGVPIEHAAIGCVVAGQFAALRATVAQPDQVAKARAYFHADQDARWYYVEMKRAEGAFQGVLPKPLAATKRIHYYVAVTDKHANETRTEEHAPEVVADAAACGNKGLMAAAAVASKVAVSAPAGAGAAPSGFAASSVAAAGGGVGATALVVGAVAVAGGGAAVVASKSGGDEGGGDATSGNQPAQRVTIGGVVYSDTCCPPGPVDPNLRANSRRIAGALIATSLDGATATSDAQGAFTLTTQTQCSGGNATYTLRISAPGCDTLNLERQWGCSFTGSTNALNLACR